MIGGGPIWPPVINTGRTANRDTDENFHPPKAVRAMEMKVIPPGTPTDPYRAYDIMLEVKARADILIPLHASRFAAVVTVAR